MHIPVQINPKPLPFQENSFFFSPMAVYIFYRHTPLRICQHKRCQKKALKTVHREQCTTAGLLSSSSSFSSSSYSPRACFRT